MKGIVYISLTIVCLSISCKQSDQIAVYDPGVNMSGNYSARIINIRGDSIYYPINGKTIHLQIERLSADTVTIKLQAPENGFYSPAKDTVYFRVPVLTKNRAYYLALAPSMISDAGENQIIFSFSKLLYIFTPPKYKFGSVSVEFTKDK